MTIYEIVELIHEGKISLDDIVISEMVTGLDFDSEGNAILTKQLTGTFNMRYYIDFENGTVELMED